MTTPLTMPNSACAHCAADTDALMSEHLVCGCDVHCGAGRCAADIGAGSAARCDPAVDIRRRWCPDERVVRHAHALLDAEPDADMAVVPMFQPGKTHGIWYAGQPVHTVFGVVLLSVNTFTRTGHILSHSGARDEAGRIAAAHLHTFASAHPRFRVKNGTFGTTAYAVIRRGGRRDGWSVFEDRSVTADGARQVLETTVEHLAEGDLFSLDGGQTWRVCAVVLFGTVSIYTSGRRDDQAQTVRVAADRSDACLVIR